MQTITCDKCGKVIRSKYDAERVSLGRTLAGWSSQHDGEFLRITGLADGDYCSGCLDAYLDSQPDTHTDPLDWNKHVERVLSCSCDFHQKLREDGKTLVALFSIVRNGGR